MKYLNWLWISLPHLSSQCCHPKPRKKSFHILNLSSLRITFKRRPEPLPLPPLSVSPPLHTRWTHKSFSSCVNSVCAEQVNLPSHARRQRTQRDQPLRRRSRSQRRCWRFRRSQRGFRFCRDQRLSVRQPATWAHTWTRREQFGFRQFGASLRGGQESQERQQEEKVFTQIFTVKQKSEEFVGKFYPDLFYSRIVSGFVLFSSNC